MSVRNIGRVMVAAGLVLALAQCEEGALPLGGAGKGAAAPAETAAATASALTLVERDVEAPEVFNLDEEGLWDGRPSLGGVWVAHSSVTDPERVIIRNGTNGKSVIGALFRREAENPGPSLQISSDAAAALEILAGSPTRISVVALRREEPDVPVVDEAQVAGADAAVTDPAAAAETAPSVAEAAAGTDPTAAVDPIAATAAAAIDEAEGIAPAAAETTADAAPAGAEVAADAGAAAKVPKKRRGLFGGLFDRRNQTAAAGDALSAAAPADAAALPDAVAAPAVSEVSTSVLPATADSAPVLQRAYVQIGIFSNAGNAQRAADQMKAAGMTATVKQVAGEGKTYWRVIVGPAASVAERDAIASRIKGIGYPDAHPVKQ